MFGMELSSHSSNILSGDGDRGKCGLDWWGIGVDWGGGGGVGGLGRGGRGELPPPPLWAGWPGGGGGRKLARQQHQSPR